MICVCNSVSPRLNEWHSTPPHLSAACPVISGAPHVWLHWRRCRLLAACQHYGCHVWPVVSRSESPTASLAVRLQGSSNVRSNFRNVPNACNLVIVWVVRQQHASQVQEPSMFQETSRSSWALPAFKTAVGIKTHSATVTRPSLKSVNN
jgi:hypothetical protein